MLCGFTAKGTGGVAGFSIENKAGRMLVICAWQAFLREANGQPRGAPGVCRACIKIGVIQHPEGTNIHAHHNGTGSKSQNN